LRRPPGCAEIVEGPDNAELPVPTVTMPLRVTPPGVAAVCANAGAGGDDVNIGGRNQPARMLRYDPAFGFLIACRYPHGEDTDHQQ
jgi:hypothetical protein